MRNWWLIFIPVLLFRCIRPLEFDQVPDDILVVEGYIDNDYGPHEFRVTLISEFAGVTDGGQARVIDANVNIIDDLGNTIVLAKIEGLKEEPIAPPIGIPPPECIPPRCEFYPESKNECPGNYIGRFTFVNTSYFTPDDFKGDLERSYRIQLVTEDGKTYQSGFENFLDPIFIEDLELDYQTKDVGMQTEVNGVKVLARWEDPIDAENFYLTNISGVYPVETGCCGLYDPRDNHGTVCWVSEKSAISNPKIFTDQQISGLTEIGFIEDDGKRFANNTVVPDKQYYIEVSHYTINEEAYNYYKIIELLSEINGEIFDTPPVRPIGNIFNVSNPNEVVVGFFGVFAKSKKGMFVNRDLLINRKSNVLCGDCRYAPYSGQLEVPEVYQ